MLCILMCKFRGLPQYRAPHGALPALLHAQSSDGAAPGSRETKAARIGSSVPPGRGLVAWLSGSREFDRKPAPRADSGTGSGLETLIVSDACLREVEPSTGCEGRGMKRRKERGDPAELDTAHALGLRGRQAEKSVAGPAKPGGPSDEAPRDRDKWVDREALREAAEQACRRFEIQNWVDDLTQALALALLKQRSDGTKRSQSDPADLAHELASEELTRRRREAAARKARGTLTHGGQVPLPAKSGLSRRRRRAPPLCARLAAAIVGPEFSERRAGELLLAASLAVIHDGVLTRGSKGRHRAFAEAFVYERPIPKITVQIGRSPHATVQLLRRTSDTLETEILTRIDLPDEARRRILARQLLDPTWRAYLRGTLRQLAQTGDSGSGSA